MRHEASRFEQERQYADRPRSEPRPRVAEPVDADSLQLLVVSRDADTRRDVLDSLRAAGHGAHAVEVGALSARLGAPGVDAVVCDAELLAPGEPSRLPEAFQRHPGVGILVLEAAGAAPEASIGEMLQARVLARLRRPLELEPLALGLLRLQHLVDARRLAQRSPAAGDPELERLIGSSPEMVALRRRIVVLARSHATVLVTGESGTGKELVARAIHRCSVRRKAPFVAINCGAIPSGLVEAELFGHERGAFTGAARQRKGRFEMAQGGTLLLDEVAELPLSAQVKLLRVLQERSLERVGGNRPIALDVRLIGATHRNLVDWVARGLFREDLYYRLNVLDIRVPALRERPRDIPQLVAHFLRQFCTVSIPVITPRAWLALLAHPYPGNVRELEHAVHRAVVLCDGSEIRPGHLPPEIAGDPLEGSLAAEPRDYNLARAMRSCERECLLDALSASGGRKAEAARLLGIARKTLWEKLRLHEIGADAVSREASG